MKRKEILTNLLLVTVICCMLFALTACGAASSTVASSAPEEEETATLERYDYVIDMSGNTVDVTIAQNLKNVTLEIKSMGLDITAFCTVEDNILTLTELAEGNEQFYTGLSATSYTLNADGTATPTTAASSAPEAGQTATLERYDYVIDMSGNTVDVTIAQNLKNVTLEIKSMGLDITAFCTVEDNVLTLTELAEGNEQFYKGLSATPYTLNADGTATPIE